MNQQNYINRSLELHLFFDRIMKEHSLFLEASFLEKDQELKVIARDFQNKFSNILKEALFLVDNNMSNEFLSGQEIVTTNTLEAEIKTSQLSQIPINTDITRQELSLKSGTIEGNNQKLAQIKSLNQRTLPIIQNLIFFKNDVLNRILSCKMFTTNYPLLIMHIMNEAKMYQYLLEKVEKGETLSRKELYEQELFWDNIMKEHAEFIRGLLDSSEKSLIITANQYANEYEKIITNLKINPKLTNVSLQKTVQFRDFKIAGEEGILNCKIKSIIIPLLADHVVREANHFLQILKNNR